LTHKEIYVLYIIFIEVTNNGVMGRTCHGRYIQQGVSSTMGYKISYNVSYFPSFSGDE